MQEERKGSVESGTGSYEDEHSRRHAPDPEKQDRELPPYDGGTKRRTSKYDTGDPFGDESNSQVKYRTLSWWQASLIMIAETISLGILSLPSVLGTIGIVGGVILIAGLGIIATYTGYVIGQFKLAYPHIHNMADAGEVLFEPLGMPRVGREFFGAAQLIFWVFLMGSHVLTWAIAFDTLTDHATCTIVWSVVGMIVMFLFTLPRTLKNVSYFSFVSFVSIFSAVLITMIAIGIEAPDRDVQVSTQTSFYNAFGSVTNIIFAYAGHVAFFSFISELRDPREYPKSLYFLQAWDISMYIVAAIVIYVYGGPNVSSPSLGSTAPVVQKVAYGIALPTIIIAAVINAHVATKYIYLRIFRGTKHMGTRSFLSVGTWVAIALTLWIIAWIIAESIPVFNDLLGLISSLFASWFTYGLSGIFWLFLNKGQYFKNWKKICLTIINIFIFALGAAICGLGLYASGVEIHQDVSTGGSKAWTCANTASSGG